MHTLHTQTLIVATRSISFTTKLLSVSQSTPKQSDTTTREQQPLIATRDGKREILWLDEWIKSEWIAASDSYRNLRSNINRKHYIYLHWFGYSCCRYTQRIFELDDVVMSSIWCDRNEFLSRLTYMKRNNYNDGPNSNWNARIYAVEWRWCHGSSRLHRPCQCIHFNSAWDWFWHSHTLTEHWTPILIGVAIKRYWAS